MQNVTITIIAALIIPGLLLSSCSKDKEPATKTTQEKARVESLQTTPADIKKEANDLARVTTDYTKLQMEEYKQHITAKMAEFQAKQQELGVKMATMGKEARAGMESTMEDLKKKRAAMDEKIIEFYSSSSEAFDKLKEGMDNAMKDMDNAYGEAMESFKKE